MRQGLPNTLSVAPFAAPHACFRFAWATSSSKSKVTVARFRSYLPHNSAFRRAARRNRSGGTRSHHRRCRDQCSAAGASACTCHSPAVLISLAQLHSDGNSRTVSITRIPYAQLCFSRVPTGNRMFFIPVPGTQCHPPERQCEAPFLPLRCSVWLI